MMTHMMTQSSRLAGFYNLPLKERVERVARWAELTEDEITVLRGEMGLDMMRADQMIENNGLLETYLILKVS